MPINYTVLHFVNKVQNVFLPGDAISTSCHVYFCIIYSVLVFKSAILLSRIRSSSFSRRLSSAKKSDVIEERLAPTEVTDR